MPDTHAEALTNGDFADGLAQWRAEGLPEDQHAVTDAGRPALRLSPAGRVARTLPVRADVAHVLEFAVRTVGDGLVTAAVHSDDDVVLESTGYAAPEWAGQTLEFTPTGPEVTLRLLGEGGDAFVTGFRLRAAD